MLLSSTDDIMRHFVSKYADESQANVACPVRLRTTESPAVHKSLLNTPLIHDRVFKDKAEWVQQLCSTLHVYSALSRSRYYLEVLNKLLKAGHMSSCLHSCSSFLVSCRLLLGQRPVKHLLQPLLQVALLHQLPPPYLHPLCMRLHHQNGDRQP